MDNLFLRNSKLAEDYFQSGQEVIITFYNNISLKT